MTDGDTRLSVPEDFVVLEETMAHAPAQEEADLAVLKGATATNRGTLASTARMESQVGVAMADTVFNDHIVALLKTNAVTVVVLNSATQDMGAVGAVKEDPGPPASVKVRVMRFTAVHC